MEPWLDKRICSVKKGSLMLSPDTERTLTELMKTTERFLSTMGSDFWNDPSVSALPYYFSIVPAIMGARNAYPYFCGNKLDKDTLAVSTYLNPDMLIGLKEPLLRYAKAMPAIAASTPNFPKSAEYSLFIFCYRTLVYVLEELLLVVTKIDTREAFSALYELDSSFEALRMLFLKCGTTDGRASRKAGRPIDGKVLDQAATRCISAVRVASKEFYVIEMLLQKAKYSTKKQSMKTEKRAENTDVKVNQKDLNEFFKKLASQ